MDGINDAWIIWKNSFLGTVTDYVPMKKVKTRRNVPWLTSEIRHLLKIKETVHRVVARALIGGGVYIHIFVLCPTNFF